MSVKATFSLAALRLSSYLPLKMVWRIAEVLGVLAFLLPTREKKVSQKNIAHALPELSKKAQNQLVKRSLQESAKSLMESSRLWRMQAPQIKTLLNVKGAELLPKNQGVIVAIPHLASWEIIGLWLSLHHPVSSLYRRAKMPAIDAYIRAGRSHFGARLVPDTVRGVMALKKALDNQEYVCILPDQDPTDSGGLFVDFFNQPAFTSTLSPKLLQKTGAAMVMAHTVRKAHGFDLHFSLPDSEVYDTDLHRATAALNKSIEAIIRRTPEQYMWSGKRYRSQQQTTPFYR